MADCSCSNFPASLGTVSFGADVTVTGNLGVGTTTPAGPVEVSFSGGSSNLFVTSYGGNAAFTGRSARGTSSAPGAVQAGDTLLGFGGRGYGVTAFSPFARCAVFFNAAENWSDSAQGTDITFETTPNGGTNRQQRMIVDNTGNVGVGVTAPAYPLDVNGNVHASALVCGATTVADGSGCYYAS